MTAACPACVTPPQEVIAAQAKGGDLSLSIPSLKCAACIQKVERRLMALTGVEDARVNLTLKRVLVKTTLDAEVLVEALADIGFEAYPFQLDDSKTVQSKVIKDLILRLGVAGFAMMNVMLLSVAVWSGASDATRDLFHLISALIALPATLFAAKPFFVSAMMALSVRRLNMDVPIALAIVLAASMSLYETLNSGAHAYFDAALSLTFFLLVGRVLEHQTRSAARSAAETLTAMEARTAKRKSGENYEVVPIDTLAIGDVIQVSAGMRVPVDGVLMEAGGFVDRAFLTGESDPVAVAKGDLLRAGEINVGVPFYLRATSVGQDTSLHQMARLVEAAETARTSYTSLADRAAQIYAPAVHLLALIAFIGWFAATQDMRHALNIAISVLIITCPCALGLAVPAVATAAIGRLYEMGYVVKSGTALERLAEVEAVVFDKTGTLTVPGAQLDLSELTPTEQRIAKGLAEASHHPVSKAISAALGDIASEPLKGLTEHPGKGITARFGKKEVALGRLSWLGAKGAGVGFKYGRKLYALPIEERLRTGSRKALADLKSLGYETHILSGDTEAKTEELSKRLGGVAWHANVTPAGKKDLLPAKAAMVGDGINDAVALSSAHASLAPASALDVARSAADVILLRDGLEQMPSVFKVARASTKLSRQNFAIAALYNAVAIPIALAGLATPMLAALAMSASSITVLLNAMRIRAVS